MSYIRRCVQRENDLEGSFLWRVIGDEMVFVYPISSKDELYLAVDAIFRITQRVSLSIHTGKFFETLEEQSLERREIAVLKNQDVLSVKAAAWIAAITQKISTPYDTIQIEYPADASNMPIIEYLGRDMDIGFRLKAYTQRRRLVVSFELAYLLNDFLKDSTLSNCLNIIGYEKLKGVWNDSLYPIIWYYDDNTVSEVWKSLGLSGVAPKFKDSFYYDEMVDFLRSIFSSALKTNDALERGILTGCLRIAKESIFTGLNNFTVRSITSQYACDCFGFTQEEIDDLLDYYDLINKRDEIKDWYDGYLFDKTEIYNPWSVLNYIKELLGDKEFHAISFWANTSSNDLVRQYIENATMKMKEEFEELINGKSIIKKIAPELTYREMNFKSSKDMNDNVYSFLLFTGYLKIKEKVYENNELVEDTYKLVIPNKEVKKIYENIFMKWFESYQRERRNEFINNLLDDQEKRAQKTLNQVLKSSISYYDNYESFYHGFMVGFLNADGYEVKSNRESGEGRFDLAVLPMDIDDLAIIIECKHSNSIKELREDSKEASNQIIEKRYIEGLRDEGYENVIGYGISFYKKQCIITKA